MSPDFLTGDVLAVSLPFTVHERPAHMAFSPHAQPALQPPAVSAA